MSLMPIKKRIGIPRALSYYNNFPFYFGFFNFLGIDVIVSDKTTSDIINKGSKLVVSETCFPVKVYVGHLVNLLEKGVDVIFVPAIQSISHKINNCSKIRGLPEIIRNVINAPFLMVEPTLDKTENIGFYDFLRESVAPFGITDEKQIKAASKAGWKMYNNFHNMTKQGVPYQRALDCAIKGENIQTGSELGNSLSVVIMAHGYNLFDERISMRLINKLEKMDIKVFTSLQVTDEEAKTAINNLGEVQYWANEYELIGTAGHFLIKGSVDGIIALSAFGCGPDSLMIDEISYHTKKAKMPLLHLTIDEHTGEAGFMTRIDAFVDMLYRKKRQSLKENIDKIEMKESSVDFYEKKNLVHKN